MHRNQILPTFLAFAFSVMPAAAQTYQGGDVIVNLDAIPKTQLPEPGQPYSAIVLKPPSSHRIHQHRAVAKTSSPPNTAAAPAKTGPAGQAAPTGVSTPVPFTFGEDQPITAPSPKVATKQALPVQTTKSAKGDIGQAGFAKRGAIRFEHDATEPQPSQINGIKLLASDLNSAIEAGATSIQLLAYGGSPGDKSSDARRISLLRARAIRQLLIDNGVPASRIDVRAMGGITDKGEPDRVDIYVRAS